MSRSVDPPETGRCKVQEVFGPVFNVGRSEADADVRACAATQQVAFSEGLPEAVRADEGAGCPEGMSLSAGGGMRHGVTVCP
ncbi:hypothetical protein DSM19430T_03400 [Desulfovibrio psychrotolerans]|uniref:Uncharacterized protein n=1 Tax=Desulfovibrio psychrotolerans TaxID=415242 RepID=A0A7J0BPM4_9BACT|nr:hypothetical protein DSM19430T_03400 [Desulfovibrio psychrotolerans]